MRTQGAAGPGLRHRFRMIARRAAFLLAATCLIAAAARAEAPSAAACALASARPMVSAQLLLGGRRRDGSLVSERAWQRFLTERVTSRFPAGLTVLSGQGQWRRPDGRRLREPSRIVLIVAPDAPATVGALQAIRAEYKAAFAQDAAGLVLSRSCASF